MYKRRADLVGFVNGLPLIFIELKATHKRLENAYRNNLADYKSTIPQIFWYNAFIILSNGSESRIGTISSDWEHFSDWKRIGSEEEGGEEEVGIVSLDTIIRGTCEKSRFMDIVENFILFQDTGGAVIKIIAKNHQYLGVNSAINKLIATLTPDPSPRGRGEIGHDRGGFQFAGLVERARELRKNQTPAEEILWEMVRDRRFLNLKFRRQHQIGDYIADFYCHDLKLIIELDGSVHKLSDVEKKDIKRDKYLRSLGFKILRIQNQTILDNPDNVLEMIQEFLPSPSGRRIEDESAAKGRLGVFWHTQGSGKSFSMIFFSQKILRKFKGNYTFVIVTDRKELDEQIYANFLSVGAVTEEEVHAESGKHLKRLLQEDHRNIFTLIQKFRTETGKSYPVVSNRSDVIVITDEAHRSQYDILAANMRSALPNAAFIAFTGTPLIVGEELTRKTFGDYVSIYNFKQSVDDGATVPLFYENRIPELQLKNEDIDEDIERILEESMLDEAQEKKLEREFARQYHLITRDDRLAKIAEDIVTHFTSRGYQGKAMVVAIDKPTAVMMYDKVQKYWKRCVERLNDDLEHARDDKEREDIATKITFMDETDMAVVVSSEQNEVERFKKLGLDIVNHRKRMIEEDLATKFKDADDKQIKGINITNRLKTQIQDIANNCRPKVKIFVDQIEFHDKSILIVNIREGEDKPYECSSGFYKRIGAISQKLTRDEIMEFFKTEGKIRFDELINEKFIYPQDFGREKLNTFLELAGLSATLSHDITLTNLGVAEKQENRVYLNNAGVLFFADEPQKFLSWSVFTVVLFKDLDGVDVIDRKEINGSLFEIVDKVMDFVKLYTKVAYRFTGKPKREEIYEYPLEAIREAVINSVMHREYFEKGHNNRIISFLICSQ